MVRSITIGYNEDGVHQKKTVYGKSRMEVESKLAIYSNGLKSNNWGNRKITQQANL